MTTNNHWSYLSILCWNLQGKCETVDVETVVERDESTVNAGLDSYLRLDALIVVGEEWTVDNGVLTPTLKIKRNRIDEVYGPHLEAWLADGRKLVWAERVLG